MAVEAAKKVRAAGQDISELAKLLGEARKRYLAQDYEGTAERSDLAILMAEETDLASREPSRAERVPEATRQQPRAAATTSPDSCPSCGAPLEYEGQKFCRGCGQLLAMHREQTALGNVVALASHGPDPVEQWRQYFGQKGWPEKRVEKQVQLLGRRPFDPVEFERSRRKVIAALVVIIIFFGVGMPAIAWSLTPRSVPDNSPGTAASESEYMLDIGNIIQDLGQSASRAGRTLEDWNDGLITDDEAIEAIDDEWNAANSLVSRAQGLRLPCTVYGSMQDDLEDSLRNYRTALDYVIIAIRNYDSAAMNTANYYLRQATTDLSSASGAYSSLADAIPNC